MVSELFFGLLFQMDRDLQGFAGVRDLQMDGSRFAESSSLLFQRVRDLQMDRDFNGL